MKLFYLFLLVGMLYLPYSTNAQSLPQEKMTDWSGAGLNASVQVYDTIYVASHGIVGDGITPQDEAVKNLIDSYANTPVVFYFPPGEFLFRESIYLSDYQVIKGAGADESTFLFDMETESHGIIVRSPAGVGEETLIQSNVTKDATTLQVENASHFSAGDFIKTISEDDDLITSEWALYSTGQIVRIATVDGNTIELETPLRRDILLENAPRIRRMEPVQFVGVECLSLERKDMTSSQTHNILFDRAANCWVRGVSSYNCNFAHVSITNSSHIEVSGSYFQDAHQYGNGGQGYGVVLQFNTGDCLVRDNVFNHLRHSILLQAGANGNVLAYNYSINPFWTETSLPENSAGDLVLHGNYPYLNLFEGNIVQNIVIDNSHGINGPGNTFFRNRGELYGIFMNEDPASDGQLFIGNEVTANSLLLGLYSLHGTDHFEHGNNVKGSIVPFGTGSLDHLSLYLNDVPEYFQEWNIGYGSIGIPNAINSGSIPAKERYLMGRLTNCEETVEITSTGEGLSEPGWQVYPNPASGYMQFTAPSPSTSYSYQLRNGNGKLISEGKIKSGDQIGLEGYVPGVYYLQLNDGWEYNVRRVVVLNE